MYWLAFRLTAVVRGVLGLGKSSAEVEPNLEVNN
jgi:hypothetical protein